MPKFLDFLRKLVPGRSKGRRIVQVVDETVTVEEDVTGRVTVLQRTISYGPPAGFVLVLIAAVVDFGLLEYFRLSVSDKVADWALGFGLVCLAPLLIEKLKRKENRVTMEVKAKAVPTVKKRVIRAGGEKKKPPAEE